MTLTKGLKLALLTGSAATAMFAGSAQAAETAAGTQIQNTASVTYTAGGAPTTVNSNTATFLVDKKVNFTVEESAPTGPTSIAFGATDQVTTFTVTNLTNSAQDFRLEASNVTGVPLLSTDNFDMTSLRVFVDSNGNGIYDAADTATFINELAPDASVKVFIVGNVPAGPGFSTAQVSLNAIVAAGGSAGLGADLTPTLGGDTPGVVDVVFADGSGYLDLARNGQQRAFDSYVIGTATVTLQKISTVLTDPVNLLVNPKAIVGATVQYCMIASNAGPQAATAVTINDVVPTGTTYVPGSLTVGGVTVLGGACVLGGAEDDDATGADETDPNGGSYNSGTKAVQGVIANLASGAATTFAFNVTIN